MRNVAGTRCALAALHACGGIERTFGGHAALCPPYDSLELKAHAGRRVRLVGGFLDAVEDEAADDRDGERCHAGEQEAFHLVSSPTRPASRRAGAATCSGRGGRSPARAKAEGGPGGRW